MEKPYQGQEPYLFLSYSHDDTRLAFDMIEVLQHAGYRIWFDEGITSGRNWDDDIAVHIEQCGYFVPLLSPNYLASDNCKDELWFARDSKKAILLVYLENAVLPAGMRMRLGRKQAIHRNKYITAHAFYEKFFETHSLDVCRRNPSSLPDTPARFMPRTVAPPRRLVHHAGPPTKIIQEGACGPEVNWTLDKDGILSVTGKGPIPELEPWVEHEKAFCAWQRESIRYKIKTVHICAGITRIGKNAFYDCPNLRAVTLPDTITSIDSLAFYQCEALSRIDFPETTCKIETEAFLDCTKMTTIWIPKSCIVEPGAFPDKVVLKRI